MKINKNSWHCKFVTGFNNGVTPKSLCHYFWCFVGGLLIGTIALICCTMILWFVLAPIWQPLLSLLGHDPGPYGITKMSLCFYALVGTTVLVSYLSNKSSIVRVIVTALVAMKNKMCPLIELVGDKNER